MSGEFDITFNVFAETPKGKDPDAHSPTLRRYHKALWSKPLPNGTPYISTLQKFTSVFEANYT